MNIISCKENKCRFEVKASGNWKLEKIQIDGGIINDNETERCDYAVTAQLDNIKHHFFYIELKGRDLLKAISQLESTIKKLPGQHQDFPNKYAHAVCSKIIPLTSSTAQVAAARFLKLYQFRLKWHTLYGCHTI